MKVFQLFILLTVVASLGCGRIQDAPRQIPSDLEELFQKGRSHRIFPLLSAQRWGLVGDSLPQTAAAQQSPGRGVLLFDTRDMPDVAAAALHQQLAEIETNFGKDIPDFRASEWVPSDRPWLIEGSRTYLNYTRQVIGLPVRDNSLQLVWVSSGFNLYRLSEIHSFITGSAELAGSVSPAADSSWIEGLTARTDVHIESIQSEWLPQLSGDTFSWSQATLFTWIMDEEEYHATLLPSEGRWLDAWPAAVHAKPLVTRALKRSYAEGGPRMYPLAFSAVDGAQGNFMLGPEAWLPGTYVPSTITLSGSRAKIFEQRSLSAENFSEISDKEGQFELSSKPDKLAAINAFVSVQRINRYARQFLDTKDAPFLNTALPVHVNLSEQSCNAYYSPRQKRLLFFKEGNGCANMALINDVIYHEWGHALDDQIGRSSGISDAAYSEGIADVIAAFYNNDASIAPFFVFNDPTPIRRLTDPRIYPQDKGDIHHEGGIIASTFWELRQELIARHGEARGRYLAGSLFFKHMLSIDSYLESYAAVLRADDTDDNPATPSPHHCLITSVFAAHGLASYSGCEDAPPQREMTSKDLNIALLDSAGDTQKVRVLASAPDAQGLALCLSARASCLQDPTKWLNLSLVGHHPDRSYFISADALKLPARSLITLIRLDSKGQLQDSREFSLYAK